ncbi:UNVERIFIED_ORG: hypothetical protein ABIC62_000725 [Burkholderia sp. 1595]|uniref:Uncharacterized protein n=1 Tax=Paraburkholderia terricola TaxID=169427 RepID=A0ABU1LKS5_9BURK|nr:hypothetical protein [Paraburkholderia terricola]
MRNAQRNVSIAARDTWRYKAPPSGRGPPSSLYPNVSGRAGDTNNFTPARGGHKPDTSMRSNTLRY